MEIFMITVIMFAYAAAGKLNNSYLPPPDVKTPNNYNSYGHLLDLPKEIYRTGLEISPDFKSSLIPTSSNFQSDYYNREASDSTTTSDIITSTIIPIISSTSSNFTPDDKSTDEFENDESKQKSESTKEGQYRDLTTTTPPFMLPTDSSNLITDNNKNDMLQKQTTKPTMSMEYRDRDFQHNQKFYQNLDTKGFINNYKNILTPDQFSYSFDTSNGIHADETGRTLKGVSANGAYSYIGDDGKIYRIEYTADENGFQPRGEHLPTPPPIPEEIKRVVELAYKNKMNGVFDDGFYDHSKYGHEKYQHNIKSSKSKKPLQNDLNQYSTFTKIYKKVTVNDSYEPNKLDNNYFSGSPSVNGYEYFPPQGNLFIENNSKTIARTNLKPFDTKTDAEDISLLNLDFTQKEMYTAVTDNSEEIKESYPSKDLAISLFDMEKSNKEQNSSQIPQNLKNTLKQNLNSLPALRSQTQPDNKSEEDNKDLLKYLTITSGMYPSDIETEKKNNNTEMEFMRVEPTREVFTNAPMPQSTIILPDEYSARNYINNITEDFTGPKQVERFDPNYGYYYN